MDAQEATHEVTVPVKVPEPEDHAPPTLAEPASGPAAEMSGALHENGTEATDAPASTAEPVTASALNESTPSKPLATTEATSATETATDEQPAAHDTEEAENTAADTSEVLQAPATDVGQASDSKKSSNGKRKSTGGVPEHKNKKLNKKKSMPKITHLDAKPGDYYFARLKSYPPWPSVICDEEMLPVSLLNTRPVTTKKKDGTYNEPYADGGKKVADRTFPIMFLYTNEFAWIPNIDLAELDPAACKDVTEKGKAKSLIAAYQVAAEEHDLQYFKDMLYEHTKAVEEDERIREEREAEKAAKAEEKKKKRKSDVKPAAEDEDVEMDDAEEVADVKKSSKKRKKEAEEGDEETEKPAKTPKTTKLKLTTNKTPSTSEKKAKEPKAAKPKANKRKSKGADGDEEMVDAEPKEEEKPLDPAEARKAREKEVLFLRHRLQKGFLSRDQAPQEDEMPQMSGFIQKLENYTDLEVSIIRTTKINKVLKALIKLNTIPKDEEFNFRKRSVELLGKWNKILGAEPTEGDSLLEKEPTTNGVHEDKTDAKNGDVPESTEKQLEPAEAVEKVSADVDASAEAKAEVMEDLDQDKSKEEQKPAEPNVIEKAPESSEGAAVAHEVVAAAE